jgi:hypothetical protein
MFAVLLLMGNIGTTELFVIMGLFLMLILAAIWRLLRPAKQTVVIQPPSSPASVADELHKLQQLRQQGVLTADEFEEQKRRLLR